MRATGQIRRRQGADRTQSRAAGSRVGASTSRRESASRALGALIMSLAGEIRARAQPDPTPRTLSEEECSAFRERGYLTVRGLLTEDELQELDEHSRALSEGRITMQTEDGEPIGQHKFPEEIDHPAGRASLEENKYLLRTMYMRYLYVEFVCKYLCRYRIYIIRSRYFRFIQFHRHLPLHEQYLLHPRILDVLESLIGPDIMAMQSMLFLKPPQQPGQGYHQDSKYIQTSPDLLCGVWIASECLTAHPCLVCVCRL